MKRDGAINTKCPLLKVLKTLADRSTLREAVLNKIAAPHRDEFLRERPIDIREVAPRDFFQAQNRLMM